MVWNSLLKILQTHYVYNTERKKPLAFTWFFEHKIICARSINCLLLWSLLAFARFFGWQTQQTFSISNKLHSVLHCIAEMMTNFQLCCALLEWLCGGCVCGSKEKHTQRYAMNWGWKWKLYHNLFSACFVKMHCRFNSSSIFILHKYKSCWCLCFKNKNDVRLK